MKRFVGIALFIGCAFGVQAQTYIDFGPKIMVGPTVLNSKVAFGSDKYSHQLNSIGWAGGFKLAFDFNTNFAVGGEVLYSSFNQQFEVKETDPLGDEAIYDKSIKITSLDFPVFARYNMADMRYIEAGVVFSNIKALDESLDSPWYDLYQPYFPIQDYYSTKKTGLMFGLGGYIWGIDNFGISGGLRFRYDFGDLVLNNEDKEEYHPVFAADAEVTNTTNPMSLMFVLEFNYDMQFYFAKNSCSGRRKILIGNKF